MNLEKPKHLKIWNVGSTTSLCVVGDMLTTNGVTLVRSFNLLLYYELVRAYSWYIVKACN